MVAVFSSKLMNAICILLIQIQFEVIEVNSFSPIILSGSSFKLPKIDFSSWLPNNNNNNGNSPNSNTNGGSKLKPGDDIVVFGGTGGVGQLVTKKLNAKGFAMRVAARDTQRADETLEDISIQTVPLDLTNSNQSLENKQEALEAALDGTSAVVISLGTTAFPTEKWKNGNTPSAIDRDAVTMIAKAASNVKSIEKVVLITSVGVDRIKEMPFLFLNLFGVLDCKRDGENAVKEASVQHEGFDYVVVRPGRLVGGPYTNLDLAKLMQIEGGTFLLYSIALAHKVLS